MRRVLLTVVAIVVGIVGGIVLAKRLAPVQAQAKPGFGFAAVPGEKGGQDITGPYEVVPDWPKPLTSLPGHEKWTWGAVEGIFAQNPNRVFIIQRGELPALTRPKNTPIPNFAPSLSFPVNEAPFRNASQGPVAALPGEGGADIPCGNPQVLPCPGWEGKEGVDARWEHCVIVVDAQGNIVEDWSQWNSLFRRPHAVYINPYDPEKRVWVVDDARHAVFIFSNDGKKLLQTLGTPNEPGADDKHFNRPTFLAWLPDSKTWKLLKYDLDGHFLYSWGTQGDWPGAMWGVHEISVDQEGNLYFAEVSNGRAQKFRPRKGANPDFLVGQPVRAAWKD